MSATERACGATRYSPRPCDEWGTRWDVVYTSADGAAELDRHPACMRHGLAEVDRHHQAEGMATCTLVEVVGYRDTLAGQPVLGAEPEPAPQPQADKPGQPTPGPWFARPDDMVGGWCVMSHDVAPSESQSAHPDGQQGWHIASFTCEADARLIAELRNAAPG